MADEGSEKKQKEKKKAISAVSKAKKALKNDEIIPVHKQLSDAGQFSYAALYATALHSLYGEEFNKKFREESLAVVLVTLEQPQQVCESVRAIVQGQGVDDMDPFVDLLLAEDFLKAGSEPLVSELLAVAIGQGRYDARMRVIIKELAWRLHLSAETVMELESNLAETLILAQYESTEEEKQERATQKKKSKYKRYALIGLATVGGGTLIGLTGGLAAPLVAAGAGAIIGGTGAAMLGTTTGVALIGSLFGVAGAGLTGKKMQRRMGAVEEFEFEPLSYGSRLQLETSSNQLHITLALTGWLTNQHRDFREPWKLLAESKEQYTLKWETKYLVQLGEALDYVFNSAVTMAAQEALKMTVLQGLLAAVAWPAALLGASNIIDNPWSVAMERSQSTGRLLADVLLSRDQGNRPVTLIGFSLGARVIFFCLEELCKRKGCEGIVEDVIILGAPVTGDVKTWSKFDRVVAGKIVNGYCRGDWLLKFLYRTSHIKLNVAGLGPVMWENRRMYNLDLSSVVDGHLDYKKKLDTIMKAVGVRTRDEVSRSSSSLKVSASSSASQLSGSTGRQDHEAMSTSMDDLSSSDDEVYESRQLKDVHIPGQPVVLEDYTSAAAAGAAASGRGEGDGSALRKTSGSGSSASGQRSGSDSRDDPSQERTVIPESTSFDSGVEVARAESEVRDNGQVTKQPAAAESASNSKPDNSDTDTGSRQDAETEANCDRNISEQRDRVGDARGDSEGSGDDDNAQGGDKQGEKDEDSASSLQRKKMFDSMYRLVLDDDLLEVMNEEGVDDDALLAERDEDESS